MRRIDLHVHTCRSDGTETPDEVVARARAAGLVLLAITDHDTTEGLAEARAAAGSSDLEILTGAEVSTTFDGKSLHVLGWGFREGDPRLEALFDRIRSGRTSRNRRILARLGDLGMPIEAAEVERQARGRIVARPHFAAALLARGYVATMQEAFDRWIGDDRPAYVVGEMPGPEEAIRAIVAAGGAAGLAHPRQLRLGDRAGHEPLLRRLVDAGLDALEVDHPSHTPYHRRMYARLAEAFDLVPTGGSDFHGAHKPDVALGVGDGTIDVREATWLRLRERIEARTRA